jgi:predicted short-subunit dehydrogenase-like oxidoreductase (DUF2520 family)
MWTEAECAEQDRRCSRAHADRPGRLAVGVVGVGRAGAALGAALARAGHCVLAASGRSQASRRRRDAVLPGVPLCAVAEVARSADLVLLAVPDDALAGVVEALAAPGDLRTGTIVVHPSGRFGLAVLEPLARAGALPLALHPVMTFAGTAADLDRLAGASFGVTAPEALRPMAETLVIEMGGEPAWVPESARPLYHAALAGAANNIVTLTTVATDLLREAGIVDPARVLSPLLTAALEGALAGGDRALTGPVARGDAGTLREHLAVLSEAAPEVVGAYVALARLTAARALADGRLDVSAGEALLDVLVDEGARR